MLADYAEERGPDTAAPWRISAAVKAMVPYWQGKTVGQVTCESCRSYVTARARSAGTARRELGVLRAAINHAYRSGWLTQIVAVDLPDSPDARDDG